jgi:hypothetical protein
LENSLLNFHHFRDAADSAESTQLWDYYANQIVAKGVTPIHEGAKTNRLCSRLVKTHGLEIAKNMVSAFLSDSAPFVRDKAWPIGLLVSQQQQYLNRPKSDLQKQPLDFGGEE